MIKQKQPQLADYTVVVNAIKAINPKHQRNVTEWVRTQRRIDFYVDRCAWAADQPVTEWHTQKDIDRECRKYLGKEEGAHDKALELESYMPRRELENATKQMIAAVEFVDMHEAAHRQMLELSHVDELGSASSKVQAAMASLIMERVAK